MNTKNIKQLLFAIITCATFFGQTALGEGERSKQWACGAIIVGAMALGALSEWYGKHCASQAEEYENKKLERNKIYHDILLNRLTATDYERDETAYTKEYQHRKLVLFQPKSIKVLIEKYHNLLMLPIYKPDLTIAGHITGKTIHQNENPIAQGNSASVNNNNPIDENTLVCGFIDIRDKQNQLAYIFTDIPTNSSTPNSHPVQDKETANKKILVWQDEKIQVSLLEKLRSLIGNDETQEKQYKSRARYSAYLTYISAATAIGATIAGIYTLKAHPCNVTTF